MFIHSRLIPAVCTRTCNMYMQNVRKNTPKTLRAYSFRQEEYNVGPKINSFHLIKNTEMALQKKKKKKKMLNMKAIFILSAHQRFNRNIVLRYGKIKF